MKKINITYNEKSFSFILIRKNVKNINLRVKLNGDIIVTANNKINENYIIDFVRRKMDWILKHKEKFYEIRQKSLEEAENIKQDRIKYLGNIYKVKIIKSDKESIKQEKDEIYIFLKDNNNEKRKDTLLNKWYRKKCEEIFNDVYFRMLKKFEYYKIPHVEIKIRKMKSRWGSCNPTKRIITLNSELIKASIYEIEFVMCHELSHLVEANHSKNFYKVLEDVMPEWKKRKEKLNKFYLV